MVSRLLYRDGLMLVIDKPAGLAVHRGPNGGESLEDHFDALRFGLPRAPALAHRLDRDTSGCLVLGRHRKALAQLGKLFKNGAIDKTYWAVVEGAPGGRRRRNRTAARPPRRDARLVDEARSRRPAGGDQVEGDGASHPPTATSTCQCTWLALEPLTGRTHQLRVHCAEMGWPILGDAIYGTAPRSGGPALHLHAREIVGAALQEPRADPRYGAGAAAHARAAHACGWQGEERQARRVLHAAPA